LAANERASTHLFPDSVSPDSHGLDATAGADLELIHPIREFGSMTVKGARSVADAGIQGSVGNIAANGGARLDYDRPRKLLIIDRLRYEIDVYHELERHEFRFNVGLGAGWALNRALHLAVGLAPARPSSRGPAAAGD
jgi:hypothetical protein